MARTYFYYGSLRKSIIKFLSIFDDLRVAKYDNDGNIIKYVDVPIKYMPKKKFFSWLFANKQERRFPMIGVEMISIEYDSERATGAQTKIDVNSSNYTLNPVPYNIGFRVSMTTEFLNEQDQLNEQLLPFFAPFAVTKLFIEELDLEWDMIVLFNGASLETEIDIEENDYRNIVWSFDFTTKTYLLKPTITRKEIQKIVHKFYLSDESWDKRNDTEMPSGQGFEDEELLILGSKEDEEIMAKYLVFN